jgi:hypothetical protein
MLFWYAWALLFFCSSGSTTAGLRTGAANNNIVRGRGPQEIPEEKWERNLQKEDKFVETENPTDYPSAAPSYSPSTTSPTELSSAQPSSAKIFVEVRLLPFSVLIHGSLSIEDESEIRKELQNYLLDSFLEEQKLQVEVTTDSIGLEMVQMVESYIPLEADEGDSESNGKNLNRSRLLSHIRRRNGHQLGRRLQSASSTSTVSTLVEYQASAILRFEQQQKEDAINNELPALQERQIEALENTGDLQGHFLKWFALKQPVDAGVNAHAEDSKNKDKNHSRQDPVVLMAVQIAERPYKLLNWKETWKEIESIHGSKANLEIETGDESRPSSSDTLDQSASFTNSGNNETKSTWKVTVGIGCALILVGLGGIFLVWRKKKLIFSKGKKSLSGEVVDHFIEITNDDDGSDEHLESITKEQNGEKNNGMTECNATITSNNTSFESSTTGNPTVSQSVKGDVNDSAIPVTDNTHGFQATAEGRSSSKSSFAFSPISFLQNSFKGKSQQQEKDQQQHDDDNDNEELDSVVAKLNLYNANDDDSMMGYSLTSLNRDRNNNAGQQDDSNSVEDLDAISVASSESDTCNPVFAGIHKILDHDNKSNNLVQYTAQTALDEKSRWNDHQDRSRSLLGDGAINDEQGEYLMMSNTFETEDAEGASTYKDDGSRKEDMSSVVSTFSSDEIINDLKYYGKDEIMMTPNKMMSMPSKEVRGSSLILPVRNIVTNSEGAMIENAHVTDDASDAPSDERKNDRSAALPSEFGADHARYTDAVRNSKLLDNDPAVLGYLVKNTRIIKNGTRGSDRQEPRLAKKLYDAKSTKM